MTGQDDRRLRELFREIHERSEPPAPPYGSMIRPDHVAPQARPWASAARASALVVLAVALLLAIRGRRARPPGDDEALRLASSLSRWEAPTDFLLRTPGIEWLQSPPRFGAGEEALPGDPPGPVPEEVSR